ncbi:unnamed protein product [Urochloa humidicola]
METVGAAPECAAAAAWLPVATRRLSGDLLYHNMWLDAGWRKRRL